jgi:starch synthase
MNRKLKILQVSPEVGPFARKGGLADAVWALSKELKVLGHDVRVAMPRYNLPGQQEAFESLDELDSLYDVPLGKSIEKISIYRGQAKEPKGIPIYLIHHEGYLYRDKIYGYGDQDGPEGFILFCRGVLEMLTKLVDWRPDVIHCHDWPTGLIPGYIKLVPEYRKALRNVATVYTIHNMRHQGIYPPDVFDWAGLSEQRKPGTAYWHDDYDSFCFKKGALISADLITTVSETYAQEIQETELGYGLEGVLKSRGKYLHGVVNGIDYESWNPEYDRDIERYYGEGYFDGRLGKNRESRIKEFEKTRFSVANLDGKFLLRKELEAVCGWEHDRDAMIISRIGRISEQKDQILLEREEGQNALEKILNDKALRVRFVILGQAEEKDKEGQRYRHEFEKLHKSYRGKLCFLNIAYPNKTEPENKEADISIEHLIYGGADAFLVPSLFEPCGLVQQQAHRYGTVPIVRATGGLVDTVIPYQGRNSLSQADGFSFKEPTKEPSSDDEIDLKAAQEALSKAIWEAFKVYNGDRTAWRTLMINGMQRNHRWRAPAEQYEKLYRKAIQMVSKG